MSDQNKFPDGDPKGIKLQMEKMQQGLRDMAKSLGIEADQIDDLVQALISGEPLYKLYSLPEDVINARYALAYNLYGSRKYAEAEQLFKWLCVYQAPNAANWMGLAASRQAQNKFEDAIDAYQMAMVHTCMQDPAPFYYGGICNLRLGKREEGLAAIEAAAFIADPNCPEHKPILERAKLLLEGNKQENLA